LASGKKLQLGKRNPVPMEKNAEFECRMHEYNFGGARNDASHWYCPTRRLST
jgi:hypothetical protein